MRALNLNKTEQVLVCIFIFLALGSLLHQFTIVPGLRQVRAARFQLKFQQDLLNIGVKQAQHRDALNNRVQELRAKIAQTRRSLFNRDEARGFLRSLPQLTGQTGNVLMIITPYDMQGLPPESADTQRSQKRQRPAAVEGDRSFMTMPVKIAISGNYSEIIRFLERLQGYGQLTAISKLKIATAQDPSEVDAELMLNLYVYEDQ